MSGHSKWHSIRHKKARVAAQRGKIFTRLIKELVVAAKAGGGDTAANPRLRSAVAAAKAANMPNDNIERAIKKGTGELPGVVYEEQSYEGYSPGGAAVFIETLTDNKNRTTAEVRHIFSKFNGNLGASGCVAWMFDLRGLIVVQASAVDEDTLMELAIEFGAEDMKSEGETFEVITGVKELEAVKEGLAGKGIPIESAEVTRIPTTMKHLEDKEAVQTLKMMDALEDQDDVQNIYCNFDIDDELLGEAG